MPTSSTCTPAMPTSSPVQGGASGGSGEGEGSASSSAGSGEGSASTGSGEGSNPVFNNGTNRGAKSNDTDYNPPKR